MPEFDSTSTSSRGTPLQAGVGNADSKKAGYGTPIKKTHYAPVRYGERALADSSSYTITSFSSLVPKLLPSLRSPTDGNFYGLNNDEDGNLVLNGGYVTAGSRGVTVDPFIVRKRASGNGSNPNLVGKPEEHLILSVTGSAVLSNGVLIPQFNLSKADISVGKEVGQTVLPTKASASGTFRTSLGQFTASKFLPNGAGNYFISFCYSGFVVNRAG